MQVMKVNISQSYVRDFEDFSLIAESVINVSGLANVEPEKSSEYGV